MLIEAVTFDIDDYDEFASKKNRTFIRTIVRLSYTIAYKLSVEVDEN